MSHNLDIQKFFNDQFGEIRCVEQDGEPWFVAADVCRALEIKNNRDALTRVDEDERGVVLTDTPGGKQEMLTINEYGLYSLVLGSRKPEAKAFKRWITHEVIPAIRSHGGYLTPQKIEEALMNPDILIELATTLKKEREAKAKLERKIRQDQPMVDFARKVSDTDKTISIGELAKLANDENIPIGRQKLFSWLRKQGYIMKGMPLPYQKFIDEGLFVVREGFRGKGVGTMPITTARVTGKGQIKLINHLKQEFAR